MGPGMVLKAACSNPLMVVLPGRNLPKDYQRTLKDWEESVFVSHLLIQIGYTRLLMQRMEVEFIAVMMQESLGNRCNPIAVTGGAAVTSQKSKLTRRIP